MEMASFFPRLFFFFFNYTLLTISQDPYQEEQFYIILLCYNRQEGFAGIQYM